MFFDLLSFLLSLLIVLLFMSMFFVVVVSVLIGSCAAGIVPFSSCSCCGGCVSALMVSPRPCAYGCCGSFAYCDVLLLLLMVL